MPSGRSGDALSGPFLPFPKYVYRSNNIAFAVLALDCRSGARPLLPSFIRRPVSWERAASEGTVREATSCTFTSTSSTGPSAGGSGSTSAAGARSPSRTTPLAASASRSRRTTCEPSSSVSSGSSGRSTSYSGRLRNQAADAAWEKALAAIEAAQAERKTGPRTIWFGSEAARLITSLPRAENAERVFPDDLTTDRLYVFLCGVREQAGLPGLRMHDGRHTRASQGIMNGIGLPTVGRMLGHRRLATAAIHARLDDAAPHAAAEKAAGFNAASTVNRGDSQGPDRPSWQSQTH